MAGSRFYPVNMWSFVTKVRPFMLPELGFTFLNFVWLFDFDDAVIHRTSCSYLAMFWMTAI